MKQEVTIKGIDFVWLALYAFAGLGTEVLYAFLIEPIIYGTQMQNWTVLQDIIHWIVTCITWGIIIWVLVFVSKQKYNFDIFNKKPRMKAWQWLAVSICVCFSLSVSYLEWNDWKVAVEFRSNGGLKFIFQYIYYLFETGLFTLIIVFGQTAFEKWFKKENIPYGGIAVALTWGLIHIFTKGDIMTGVISAIGGFFFGIVYLLTNRDIKRTFVILCIMFII